MMFQDLEDSKQISSERTKTPRRSDLIQTYSILLQTHFRFIQIYLGFKTIHEYSRFIEIPPSSQRSSLIDLEPQKHFSLTMVSSLFQEKLKIV